MHLTPYNRNNSFFSLFDNLERSFFNDSINGMSQFRCDITEKDGSYGLEAELPGFDAKDIDVNVNGDTLTISATQSSSNEEKDDEGNYIRRERRYGSFSRSFDVTGIDTDAITADYENGVLKLELPKAEEQKPESRRIEVAGGQNAPKTSKEQTAQTAGRITQNPSPSVAEQKAEYSAPAKEQVEEVQKNSTPEQYAPNTQNGQAGMPQ